MKTKHFIIALFSLSLITTSCSNDDDGTKTPEPTPNIVELAQQTPSLSSLVAALLRADGDLATVLAGNGPFTVLAPTNDAFATFLSDNGFNSLEELPTDVLSQVLLNHVIMADVSASDLISMGSGYTSGSATGAGDENISIYFDATNGVTFNNIATVTTADVNASNGTVHIIDAVLGLPSVVDLAISNSDFSNLVAALGAADGDLVSVLSGDGPFTVLAPSDAAFSTFLDGAALGDVDTGALSQILLNHVIIGSTITSTALLDLGAGYTNTGATGPSSNALSLYFNTTNGVMFNGISTVTKADIVGTNGIIHAIDTVIDIPTVVTFAVADPNFSTLVDALTTLTPATDFATILSRTETGNSDMLDPNFTVFAPTNDAFAALTAVPEEAALTQILLHHVIKEANITSSMLTNPGDTTAATIEGDDITISLPGTGNNIANITDGSGATDIGIVAVDVQAENGVIHAINKVMINN
ncbi:fasciclin domain-containing protein [Algibacter sp. Ld11]|uniref:fasciclin domain-containing protein n=1 Tax=Algibacter sp. Ld11 TaxID=649150 RepID=UPI00386E48FC